MIISDISWCDLTDLYFYKRQNNRLTKNVNGTCAPIKV